MNKPTLFPGFPKGENGVIRTGVIKTAEAFSRGSEKSKQLGVIMSVLGDALADEGMYQEIFKKIHSDYQSLSDWWNKEMYQKQGGEMGTGKLIVKDVENDTNLQELTKGIDPEAMHFLQMQIQATNPGGPLVRMSANPNFGEELKVFNEILWVILISAFKQGGLDKLSAIFRRNSGKNWA